MGASKFSIIKQAKIFSLTPSALAHCSIYAVACSGLFAQLLNEVLSNLKLVIEPD